MPSTLLVPGAPGATRRPSLSSVSARPLKHGKAPSVGPLSTSPPERRRNVDLAPWRMVCRLQLKFRFGSTLGSGWLAGPKTVITAGHCVFDKSLGGDLVSVVVEPGYDEDLGARFGRTVGVRWDCDPQWSAEGEPAFDYGFIQLQDPLGDAAGTFAFDAMDDDDFERRWANVAGYPKASPFRGEALAHHADVFEPPASLVVSYHTDTLAGMSGGPVFVTDRPGDPVRVVAIHTSSVTDARTGQTTGSACRITPGRLDRIRTWVAQA